MQSFAPTVLNAADNQRVSESLRFFAQRFAELADSHVHFAASASLSLDPITAAREFLELSKAYDTSGGKNPSPTAMRSAVHRTRNVLARDANIKDWYPAQRAAAVAALSNCVDTAAAKAAGVPKNVWLGQKTALAGRGPVRLLLNDMVDANAGYRPRLMTRTLAQANSPILAPPTWRSYDNNIRLLAAALLSEGRDGYTTAMSVARSIRTAGNSADAANELRRVLSRPADPYVVAFHLLGITRPHGHTAFDCRWIRNPNSGWRPGSAGSADVELAGFVSGASPNVVLTTSVAAFDSKHAYELAMQRAERLCDQYAAQHRAYAFGVHPEMAMLNVTTLRASRFQPLDRRQPRPRTLMRAPDLRLEQSLRFAALARAERVSTVKVLHSWIALESLVRGPGTANTPYPFLVQHLPPLLALHAVRQAVSTTWHVARKSGQKSNRAARWQSIENWLGVAGPEHRVLNLNRWVDLIEAVSVVPPGAAPATLGAGGTAALAAENLSYVMQAMTPFARQNLLQWHFLLELGFRLSAWCVEMEARARATIERMYAVRNSAVHAGVIEAGANRQLAHASENVVDCVFEVLPPWLASGRNPAQAIEAIGNRSRRVTATWNKNARPPLIDAQNLTRPGGDGMTR